MKLSIPLLLYVVSLGLVGLTGWTVQQTLPIWSAEVRDAATRRGQDQSKDLLGKGRSQGPQQTNWMYTRDTARWWEGLTEANLIGKRPPPDPGPPLGPPQPARVDQRPLDQLIELVSLVYDSKTGGKGGNSHVVVRFKPEANVQPPDWWVKENMAGPASGSPPPAAHPRDAVKGNGGGKPGSVQTGPSKTQGGASTTPPMASVTGREMLQKLWVQDDGEPRRSAMLWPMKSNDGREIGTIRLVRVADDALSAFFVRELPPPKPGEPAPEPKEEELLKTSADLSQDIQSELRLMQGRGGAASRRSSPIAAPTSIWTEVDQTTPSGNDVIISREDADRFRDHPEDLLEQITVDPYAGRNGTKGLIVKAVDARLASFGVIPGEVLLEINGKKVESKAQAASAVKSDYKRGVRTFTTKWSSNGQVIERTFQAPPDK